MVFLAKHFFPDLVHWVISESDLVKERGPATVTINHGNVTGKIIRLMLQGQINFNHCFLRVRHLLIKINGSQPKPALTEENVRMIQSSVADPAIKKIQN